MSVKEFFWKVKSKANAAILQLFTPREFKSLLLFLGIGFAVLLFRGGKELFYTLYPPSKPNEFAQREAYNDSLFAALSQKVINEDSLKFSIPEDSIVAKEKAEYAYENKKVKTLTPHSIPINHAEEGDLVRLPGVGKVTAERILTYRTKRGSFRNIREVMNVQGIGEKKFKQIEAYLRLN
ncbi:MAG: helix-hairpin-helix domain-containing protein [bacterium]